MFSITIHEGGTLIYKQTDFNPLKVYRRVAVFMFEKYFQPKKEVS